MDKRVKVLVTIGILILLIAGFYISSYLITKYTGYTITGKLVYSKDEQMQIGKCMQNKGIVLYCTALSFNCLRQKNDLGLAYNFISYVDCNENFKECEGISIPAWKINEKFYYGIYDLEGLSKLSGCSIRQQK